MPFVPLPGTRLLCSVWETRVRDFEAFVRATGHDAGRTMFIVQSNRWEERAGFNWQNPGFAQGPDHPVVGVNWHDAVAFCDWLTATERAAGLLTPTQRYRLPTDLEWSRAVGLTNEPGSTPQQRFVQVPHLYPWGTNATPSRHAANLGPVFDVDPFERTAPVGTFPPNALGLHDLAGNVIEWCDDAWDTPPRYKVLRGSGWHTDCASCLLSSYRYPNLPELRIDYYGFRPVLDLTDALR
jgi:formylglycine-generating enzyme required for sulfatase activity